MKQEVFAEYGIVLAEVRQDTLERGFARAMDYLVGVAHEHLRDAMRYTLLIPGPSSECVDSAYGPSAWRY